MALNPHSAEVGDLIRDIEAKIEKKRDALERKGKDEPTTEYIRGEIKSFRNILLLIKGADEEPET